MLSQPLEVRSAGWLLAAGLAVAVCGTLVDGCNALTITWGMRTAAAAGCERDWRSESWLSMLNATAGAAVACTVALVVALFRGR